MSTKRLLAFALGSALLSAGCFGGAYTLLNASDTGSDEIVTREMPWDGSTLLAVDVPSVVRYIQTPGGGTVLARGPQRSVDTLSVSQGHVHDELLHTGAVLELLIRAPSITHFVVNGRTRLTVESYDQPVLSIQSQGAAAIEVSGRAREIHVAMQGSGSTNLSRVHAQTVHAKLGGTSALVTGPADSATLEVGNLASAVLVARPGNVVTKLSEAGRVIDAAPNPPALPAQSL